MRSYMASEVFVDTSAFYAMLVRNDEAHERACAYLHDSAKKKRLFVTSDYILDETFTLLRARKLNHLIEGLYNRIIKSEACTVVWTDQSMFHDAKAYFIKHSDKDWSFTDCHSFCVMKKRKIKNALTKNHHFNQAGFKVIL